VSRLSEVQNALGDQIRVSRLIGTGGFAEVYAATDERLGRALAVKVLRAELASTRSRERFVREARAAAQVRHPNVLSIFDVGDKDGIVWFTMPLVVGESLRERLDREKRIDPEEATRILRAAAAALHAAHRAGLVHRDVKPDNILLDGPERDVLLADFGVAAALAPEGERITTEGTLVGTPRYMSPEQAAGESTIDARSDVYALGVVGYEMIAGEPPFTAANASALLAKHLTAPVPLLRDLVSACPAALAATLERCLAKDPADRWPTADAVRQALEGRVSRSSTPMAKEPEKDSARPSRSISTLLVMAAVVALAIGIDLLRSQLMLTPLAVLATLLTAGALYGARVTARLQQPTGAVLSGMDRQVRRARALRTAGRAMLAGLPKAWSQTSGPVGHALDTLLFEVESAATRSEPQAPSGVSRRTSTASGAREELRLALAHLEELFAALERTFDEDPERSVPNVRSLAERFSRGGSKGTGV
jgi:serine/threonine-protein kinase